MDHHYNELRWLLRQRHWLYPKAAWSSRHRARYWKVRLQALELIGRIRRDRKKEA